MKERVFVIGVGMTKFEKPFSKEWDYPDIGRVAGHAALADAGIRYELIEQVAVGYVYGDSTCGQRAVYELGLTGIPIINVNNNCGSGSTALFMSYQLVAGGVVDCTLALGFEKMEKGSLVSAFPGRTPPLGRHLEALGAFGSVEAGASPPAAWMFANAAREHMERYGTTAEQFARIALKNHEHSTRNPYAQFQQEYTLDEIRSSPTVCEPLTRLQCCPTSDGGAAAVLASDRFVREHGLVEKAVEVIGMAMSTDRPGTFDSGSCIDVVGAEMTGRAARQVYEQAGVGPEEVDVIELHDCFSVNELISYEALGLCPEGQGGTLIGDGATTYGGDWVVNPSGGLISKGHPLGATGLAQCAELNWQLRSQAGPRQVHDATIALQQNAGLGGACVVAMYRSPST